MRTPYCPTLERLDSRLAPSSAAMGAFTDWPPPIDPDPTSSPVGPPQDGPVYLITDVSPGTSEMNQPYQMIRLHETPPGWN